MTMLMNEPAPSLYAALVSVLGKHLFGQEHRMFEVFSQLQQEGSMLTTMHEDPLYTAARLFQQIEPAAVDQSPELLEAYRQFTADPSSTWNQLLQMERNDVVSLMMRQPSVPSSGERGA